MVLAALLATGCSTVEDRLGGGPAPAGEAAPPSRPGPVLETLTWGVVDGMLSVVVRNTTDHTLRYAEGVVTARTADDQLVATSLEYGDAACCEVQELGPGQKYGFYVDIGGSGDDISRVDVAYRNVAWDQGGPVADGSTVSARPVGLRQVGLGTVVLADVTSEHDEPVVVAQAFLNGPTGELVAVVSGRWRCVQQGTERLRMQLFHQVPAGTRIAEVSVHPVENDPTRPAPRCAGSSGAPAAAHVGRST